MTRSGQTLRSIADLRDAGLALAGDPAALAEVTTRYAVAVTPDMARLIARTDADDPIARQFVPDVRELQQAPHERADPLSEERLSPVANVVHRYADRALLKLTHVCPVYCRFCFRREVVGPGGPQALSGKALDAALAYIAATPAIWEVILTGGDPFMLSPRRIAEVTRRLGQIAHVKVLRWHTRVPVADPGRVTDELVAALRLDGKDCVRGAARQPSARADGRRACRLRPPRRRRRAAAQPDRPAQGHQRRCRDAGSPDARVRGGAREALLPAPPRCGARHRPLPRFDRRGPAPDAQLARSPLRSRPAHLRARHPRRPRQGADWPRLPLRRWHRRRRSEPARLTTTPTAGNGIPSPHSSREWGEG